MRAVRREAAPAHHNIPDSLKTTIGHGKGKPWYGIQVEAMKKRPPMAVASGGGGEQSNST